jgi:hypothetical protein
MFERSAGRLAAVLEQQDVAEPAVLLEVVDAVAEGPQHLFDLAFGHVGKAGGMIGSLDDDLVGSHAVHLVIHAFTLAVEVAFDAQDGKLIGHHAHAPAWLVATAAGAVSQNFGRSLSFIPGIERAMALGGDRHRLPNEIGGPLGAVGGNNHPPAGDRVFTQFRQLEKSLRNR